MLRRPASPRARRRIGWLGLTLAAAAAAALMVALLPGRSPERTASPAAGAPTAQPAPGTTARRATALSAADRRAIDATLDRFVPAALERRDPGLAWELSGPDLRGSATRSDWVAGELPVFPFAPRGRAFHHWRPDVVEPGRVSFDLLLQPRDRREGAITFSVELVRRGGRWLVDRWYPIATFTPVGQRPHVVGPNDFTPPAGAASTPDKARLAPAWLLVPAAVVGLLALVALALAARAWLRVRRGRRALALAGRTHMPELPSSVRARVGEATTDARHARVRREV